MKDVAIYMTREQYADFLNGSVAIGFTFEELQQMKKWEKDGIDCGLTYDPLDNMTKVRPWQMKKINNCQGFYVSKKYR